MTEILHIYTRVSSAHQAEEGTSLESQKDAGISKAKELGMDHQVWNEGGRSSSNDDLENRPVLVELLTKIEDGEVKNLYVWNEDRLSRSQITWMTIRVALRKNDVTLYTPSGLKNLHDPQTDLITGILGEFSAYDNRLRAIRTRMGKLNRVKNGGWMGGPPPYGYCITDHKLVVNPEEAQWVVTIYTQYRDGKSVDEVRDLLLKNTVKTRRGNPVWSHGSIQAVLKNTHYGGHWNYHDKKFDETVRCVCPRILDATLIRDVHQVREKRSYKKGGRRTKTSNQKYEYLLTGLLECGHCGAKYGGNHKVKQTSYYSCGRKTNKYKTKYTTRHKTCKSQRNIRIDRTDELVWNTVIEILSKSHLFKETVKNEILKPNLDPKKTEKKRRKKVKSLNQDIEKVTQTILTVKTNALIDDQNPEESKVIVQNLEKHRLGLEAEREEIERNLASTKENEQWVDWVKSFGNRIEELRDAKLPIEEKKNFLTGVLRSVTVTEKNEGLHELQITFCLPFVGDTLVWKDPSKKGGYSVKNGDSDLTIACNLKKK